MSWLFKKELNQNFVDYVWDVRLKKAKQLLVETDMNIDEIAFSVGYTTSLGFRKKFKETMGTTPAQYRKNQRESSN